jgi:hypothetical protein
MKNNENSNNKLSSRSFKRPTKKCLWTARKLGPFIVNCWCPTPWLVEKINWKWKSICKNCRKKDSNFTMKKLWYVFFNEGNDQKEVIIR